MHTHIYIIIYIYSIHIIYCTPDHYDITMIIEHLQNHPLPKRQWLRLRKRHVRRLRLCHIRSNVFGSEVRLGIRDPFGVWGKKNRGRIPRKWWTCGFMGIYIWIHLVLYSHSTFKHHDCGSLRCVLVVSLMVMVIINKLRPQVAEVFQWVSLGLCLPYSIRMDALGRSILAWRLPDVSPSIQPDLEWPKVRKQNPTAVEMCEI